MPKIKHIAISTQDVDKTARFYIDVFGLKEIGKVDSPNASGYYLSDGDINMAILNFKNDAVAGGARQGVQRHPPHRLPGREPGGDRREARRGRLRADATR